MWYCNHMKKEKQWEQINAENRYNAKSNKEQQRSEIDGEKSYIARISLYERERKREQKSEL